MFKLQTTLSISYMVFLDLFSPAGLDVKRISEDPDLQCFPHVATILFADLLFLF
jgi:hypothetical protein